MNKEEFSVRIVEFAKNNKEKWNELDALQGDGDLGTTLFLAAKSFAELSDQCSTVQEWFERGGKAVRKSAPSTMGILIASSLISTGKFLKDSEVNNSLTPKDWVKVQHMFIESIQKRGGAKKGDKTILDALIPAVEAFEAVVDSGGSLREALKEAFLSAKTGAENTVQMTSKTGRSSWLGERSKGKMDGGAFACYQFYEFLSNYV